MSLTEAAAEYERTGWVVIPDFIVADELADLRLEADRLGGRRELFAARGAVPNSPSRSDRLDPVIDLSRPFAALAGDPRLVGLAGTMLGGEAQLLKDKLIFKPPGARGYDAHQDGAYWQGLGIDPGGFVTAILFLDDCTLDKDPIECAAGHHSQLLTASGRPADLDEGQVGSPFRPIEARAGDLLLLHSLTPHRSRPNRSAGMRRLLMFTYARGGGAGLYRRYRAQRRT